MSWNPKRATLPTESNTSIFPEVKSDIAAPISQPNVVQNSENISEKKYDYDREYAVRRDADTQKNFSVTLLDIDTTIIDHLGKILNIKLPLTNQQISVPIIYASPERWKSIRKDGYIRDQKGQIQSPLLVIKRSDVTNNDQLKTFNRHLTYPVIKKYSQKNKYDKFGVQNNIQVPVKEVYNVTLPDHVIITYDFMAWTDYIVHMNKIIEIINFATEDYWGDKERFKFRTSIQNYTFETDLVNGQDRMVKSNFSMTVWAYLLPEQTEDYRSTTQKRLTTRQVVITAEIDSKKQIPKKEYPVYNGIEFVTPRNGQKSGQTVTYDFISKNKEYIGEFVDETFESFTVLFKDADLIEFENFYIKPFNLFIDDELVDTKCIKGTSQNNVGFYIFIDREFYKKVVNENSKIFITGKFE